MINIADVKDTIVSLLNGTSTQTTELRPSDKKFVGAFWGSFLDSTINGNNNYDFLVFIDTPSGRFEAIPKLLFNDGTFQINFYYKLTNASTTLLYDYVNYLAKCLVGKYILFGSNGAICNMTLPTFGAVQPQSTEQFASHLNDMYKTKIDKTEIWGICSFTLFLTNVASGYMWGNQIKYLATFAYGGSSFSDVELVFLTSASQDVGGTNTQQLLSDANAKSLVKDLGHSFSISAIYDGSNALKAIVDMFNNRDYANKAFVIAKNYYASDMTTVVKTYLYDYILVNISEVVEKGKLLSYNLTFTIRATIKLT